MAEKEFEIIRATGWSKGREGLEYPSRLVVVSWITPNGNIKEFSRHWQTKDGTMFWGHYFHPRAYGSLERSLEAAVRDFEETLVEHNSTYGVNNISHLPKARKVVRPKQKTHKKAKR
jgi:hypothetical protein